jgi:uncharacterized protein YceK
MTPKTRVWAVLVGLLAVCLLIDACATVFDHLDEKDREWAAEASAYHQRREKQCTDLGGVAIFSGWTNDLARCEFPPAAVKR